MAAKEYHGINDIVIEGCIMDHSDPTALGLENILGHRDATVGCFTHVNRKFLERLKSKGLASDGIDKWIQILELLRRAPSEATFDYASNMLLKELQMAGLKDVSDWFDTTYLKTCHRRFGYCHTKPGIQPMNQLLESVNAAIKNLLALYAAMPEFCNDGLPDLSRYVTLTIIFISVTTYSYY
jgi:hypothetical protein